MSENLKIDVNNSTFQQWKTRYNDLVDVFIGLQADFENFDFEEFQAGLAGKLTIATPETLLGGLTIGDGAEVIPVALRGETTGSNPIALQLENADISMSMGVSASEVFLAYVDGVNNTDILSYTNASGLQIPVSTAFSGSVTIGGSSALTTSTVADIALSGDYADLSGVPLASGSVNGLMSSGNWTKLDGIAAGAQVNVPHNLGRTLAASTVTVTITNGDNTTIPAATTTDAGVFSADDKVKLNSIDTGAQVNVGTDLEFTGSGNSRTIESSTGGNASIPTATGSNAGLMSTGDKSKLDGIAAGAQVNVAHDLGTTVAGTGENRLRTITITNGNNIAIPNATQTNPGFFSIIDKTKLDGIDEGAQVNVGTNLGQGGSGNSRSITSSTGNNVTVSLADASNAGFMSTQHFTLVNSFNSTNVNNWNTAFGWGNHATAGYLAGLVGGSGISITSGNNIAVDGTVIRTTGNQSMSGIKTFSTGIVLSGTGTTPGQFTASSTAPSSTTNTANYHGVFRAGALRVGNIDVLTKNDLGINRTATQVQITGTNNALNIEGATTSLAGIVTNANQTWAGNKTSTNFTATSDERLKKDMVSLVPSNCFSIVDGLLPKSFVWKDSNKDSHGLIAQEVEKVAPLMVHTDDAGMKSVNYSKLTTYLIGAIKHLNNRISTLELQLRPDHDAE